MTVGCIDSGCGHDAHHQQVMPTDDSALIVVEGMRPTCTTSGRAGWLASGIGASERRWRVCLAPGIRHGTQMPSCEGIGGGERNGPRTRRGRTRALEGITSSYQLADLEACTGPALIYSLPTIPSLDPPLKTPIFSQ